MIRDDSTMGLKLLDEYPSQDDSDDQAHDRGLLMIGMFKLSKALFFFALGMGAVHFLHRDLGNAALQLAEFLKMNTESRFVLTVLNQLDQIDPHRLRWISFGTFGYSGLALTEGIGLMMEKAWAEYLTLFLTTCFLPYELYEVAVRVDWFRISMLAINILVLGYLLYALRKKRHKRREEAEARERLNVERTRKTDGSTLAASS